MLLSIKSIYFLLIEWYTCMAVIIKFLFEGCIFSKKWFKSVCVRETPCYWRSSRDGGDRTRSIYTLSWLNFNFKIIWFWEASKYKSFCDPALHEHFVSNFHIIFILNFVYRFQIFQSIICSKFTQAKDSWGFGIKGNCRNIDWEFWDLIVTFCRKKGWKLHDQDFKFCTSCKAEFLLFRFTLKEIDMD